MGNTTQDDKKIEGQSSKTRGASKAEEGKSGPPSVPTSGREQDPAAAQGFHSWTPAPLPPPAADDGTTASWILATLGATFDIKQVIPQPFSGSGFPEFFLRFQQADKQMASYGFSHTMRYLQLLKTLEGLPLQYVNLSLTSEESYVRAIETLKKLYLPQQNAFRDAWKQSLHRPKTSPTWESRSAFHAHCTALFNTAEQLDQDDVWREAVFVILEERMDPGLQKEWAALTSKYRDENNSIGHTVSIEMMLDMVLQVMTRDLRIQQTGTDTLPPPPKGRVRVPWAE